MKKYKSHALVSMTYSVNPKTEQTTNSGKTTGMEKVPARDNFSKGPGRGTSRQAPPIRLSSSLYGCVWLDVKLEFAWVDAVGAIRRSTTTNCGYECSRKRRREGKLGIRLGWLKYITSEASPLGVYSASSYIPLFINSSIPFQVNNYNQSCKIPISILISLEDQKSLHRLIYLSSVPSGHYVSSH
jgi:hypothetical protein